MKSPSKCGTLFTALALGLTASPAYAAVVDGVTVVPEPTSALLVGLGSLCFIQRMRRRG